MKVFKKLISTLFLVIVAITHANATVGGGQHIEVLGYSTSEQKLYVLRHYEDAGARIPQLSYFKLNSKTPRKLRK